MNIAYISSLRRLLFDILPKVDCELEGWKTKLKACEKNNLRNLAEVSIKFKKFHCQGGSVYGLLTDKSYSEPLIKAIVAVQTISDYLDNLCDRRGIEDEQAFRQVHNAFLDALSLEEPQGEYYKYYPDKNDEGFLESLVTASRNNLAKFPCYPKVQEKVLELAQYYCDLQVYKHLSLDVRERKLTSSLNELMNKYPEHSWYELAAATGSTLGIFTLMASSTKENLLVEEVNAVFEAYFPWICGLHILLDYYIDQAEDVKEGDLNFVSYYPSRQKRQERISLFIQQALLKAKSLPNPKFHRMVVRGLLALYLTDTKLKEQSLEREAKTFIKQGGLGTLPLYGFCRTLRTTGKI